MISLALAALTVASLSLPPGTVVAGVSTHDGTHTDITAFLPDGSARVLFVEQHAAGFVPKGSLSAQLLALAVQRDGAEGATVVVLDHATGLRVVVGERAIASQAPRIHDAHVTWLRAAENTARSTFDVVRAPLEATTANEEVLASIDGAWLSPLHHNDEDDTFLHITSDGIHRVVALRDTSLEVARVLGKGPMRLPALTTDGAVVERSLGNGRARLERDNITLREGIAGMDPIVVDGARDVVVAGAGSKRAALIVWVGREATTERVIELGRAGVATPLAAAATDVRGDMVVVARIDRGRSLSQEVWIVDARGARALTTSGVVEVYGIVGAGGAR